MKSSSRRPEVLLALLIVVVFVGNAIIVFHDNDTSIAKYIMGSSSGLPSVNAKEGAVSSGQIVECQEGQFPKVSSCADKAIQQLKEEWSPTVLKELKKEIRMTQYEKLKVEMAETIKNDYTKNLFMQQQVDGKLMDELKAAYLAQAEKNIKSFIATDLFQALKSDKEFGKLIGEEVLQKLLAKMDSMKDLKTYYEYLFSKILDAHTPAVDPLTKEEIGQSLGTNYLNTAFKTPFTFKQLTENRVNPAEDKLAELQKQHDRIVSYLRELKEPANGYKGKGIVIPAGESTLGAALVLLAQLKELETKLPIELILNSDDQYDAELCENTLPNQFNTRCIVLERVMPVIKDRKLTGFQYKSLALLASSFSEIISLDADSLPLKRVDYLFDSVAYLKGGFVLWPDIWQKTTSPKYYDIARFVVGEPTKRFGMSNEDNFVDYISKEKHENIAFHDLEGVPDVRTVESGQMVFDKSRHFRSLVLSIYYNLNGPDFYYHLLFQGGPGTGDKETLVPALEVFDSTYYIVEHDPDYLGYKLGGGPAFQETTLVQFEPDASKFMMTEWRKFLSSKNLDSRSWPYQMNGYTKQLWKEFQDQLHTEFHKPEPLFLHVHKPKINPATGYKDELNIMKKRIFGDAEAYTPILGENTDWELKFHTLSKYVACSLESGSLWTNVFKLNRDEVCDKVSQRVEQLKQDSIAKEFGELKVLKA